MHIDRHVTCFMNMFKSRYQCTNLNELNDIKVMNTALFKK